MSKLAYSILHRSNGRIRIRLNRVKSDQAFRERLYAVLKSKPGVCVVRIAESCASVLIVFEEKRFLAETVLQELSEEAVLLADLPLGRDSGKRLRKNSIYKLANALEATAPLQLTLGFASLLAAALSLPPVLKRGFLLIATIPLFGRGVRTLYEERRPGVDLMDGASILILTLETAYVPAAIMVLLIAVGEYIRDFATKRSEAMLDELLSLSRSSAWLVRNETRVRVPVEKIKEGDSLVVYTGEQVPVNGVIREGAATVIIAGAGFDTLPIEVEVGDKIPAESIVLEGKLYLSCTAPRLQAVMDRIMERERRRHLYRTSYQRVALKRAYGIITPVLLFAASAFLFSRNLNQALTIICFDFITGIRIALPTAILAYMYRAGKDGVLIKTGAALEELGKVDVIVFARTGVVTAGVSELTELIPLPGFASEQILSAAAAVEYRYHHPAARAIYRYAKQKKISITERKNSQLFAGMGVIADLEGCRVSIGSRRFMQQQNISVDKADAAALSMKGRGDSVVYVAFANELVGLIAYRDTVRHEAGAALLRLKQLGISELVMTSGDSGESVGRIASQIGIERVYSQLSPEEKADLVRDYQLRGKKVALVGDDVSDALAMAQADLAIAMNDSTDVARYRADIIITDDDLNHLPATIELSRQAMIHLRQNMLFVSLPNWLGLLLSVTNAVGPVRGTVLNNGSVILAALNDLRPALRQDQSIEFRPLN